MFMMKTEFCSIFADYQKHTWQPGTAARESTRAVFVFFTFELARIPKNCLEQFSFEADGNEMFRHWVWGPDRRHTIKQENIAINCGWINN